MSIINLILKEIPKNEAIKPVKGNYQAINAEQFYKYSDKVYISVLSGKIYFLSKRVIKQGARKGKELYAVLPNGAFTVASPLFEGEDIKGIVLARINAFLKTL